MAAPPSGSVAASSAATAAPGGAGPGAAAAAALVDEATALVAACLPKQGVLALAAASPPWRLPARADRVWIRLCRERWRFGTTFGSTGRAAPGARDASSLKGWRSATEPGRSLGQEAFRFYVARAKADCEARDLVQHLASHDAQQRGEARLGLLARGAEALDVVLAMEQAGPSDSQQGFVVLRNPAREVRQEMSDSWAEEAWRLLISQPGEASSLEEGALVLAQWTKPDADVPGMRLALERLAARAAERGASRTSSECQPPAREEAAFMIEAVNGALFEEYGLQGNVEDYYNTDNTFLHTVLERRLGIPISLCILWAAVAQRRGLPCHLLAAFPQHVVVRVPVRGAGGHPSAEAETDLYVDAFDRGRQMDWEALAFFARRKGLPRLPMEQYLHMLRDCVAVSPPVDIYCRLLQNLMHIYAKENDRPRLLGVLCQLRVLGRAAARGTLDNNASLEYELRRQLGRSPPGDLAAGAGPARLA